MNLILKGAPGWLAAAVILLLTGTDLCRGAAAERRVLKGHVPPVVAQLAPLGRVAGTNQLRLSIGLNLRDQDALNQLMRDLYDPASPVFHKYLTPKQFARQFGPTEEEYQAVKDYARSNGLVVTGTHASRLVLEVAGGAADIERAFQVRLRTYRHPTENRIFYAPEAEPSVPTNLPVADLWGLSDYGRPRSLLHRMDLAKATPFSGSGSDGLYLAKDLRNAYVPGSVLTGAGQTVGLLEFDGYNKSDITNYENIAGLTNRVALNNELLQGDSGAAGSDNDEVCLDIEMAIAMAPGLAQVIVYEINGAGGSYPNTILAQMADDDTASQMSSSWSWEGGPSTSIDSIFEQMIAQGQCFFQAAGDTDAYTGSNKLDSSRGVNAPVDSPYLVAVGGTTLSMNGAGGSWAAETVWNYASNGGSYANEGSSGGTSRHYGIPSWQTGVSMAINEGSTTFRNLPDVALAGDEIYFTYNSGTNGGAAGTSCAAPLWAGLTALVNQQAAAASATNRVGFLNPAFYAIGLGTNYAACFNDIQTGNNIGTGAAGEYYATNGYDLASGWGTPTGTNLINTLAPQPCVLLQPVNKYGANGGNVTLSVTAGGQTPLAYQWFYNGASLTAPNVAGAPANTLTLTNLTLANAGNFSVAVTNGFGAVTSSVAVLTVGYAPVITAPPASQLVLAGSNVTFGVTATGSVALAYQWLRNGAGLAGATASQLTLAPANTNSSGNYSVVVTNVYGSVTSSVASLTVVQPPVITTPLAGQTIQCSSNATFAVTVIATPPPVYQWTLDGAVLAGATGNTLTLTNVHLPSHTVSVMVANLYGGATNTAALTVQDTLPPVITLIGANPFYVELGGPFTDPGATATDACAGPVAVTVTGAVNSNGLGTNTLVYSAADGNGNTGTVSRAVIVRDTTPPTILWSFTNLVLAAGANCETAMPNATGTNYIIATDLSGPPVITQIPATNAVLALGVNKVILTATDTSGNASHSTNTIVVADETPPVIVTQPQSLTNPAGGPVSFSAAATACTPVSYQWYFNSTNEIAGATNAALAFVNVDYTNAGNYSVVAAANGGSTTSAAAVLTVIQPPIILTPPVGQTVECSGTAAFAVTAAPSPPPAFQWSEDGAILPGATNASLTLTNVHLPGHLVSVVVSNYYVSATNTVTLNVQDTKPPVLTLLGANPLDVELGSAFADPGATATDACAGAVSVTVTGTVNSNVLGTNTLVYAASDGNGNTGTVSRVVIVRDTTPPTIPWSFTNLVLAAGPNCAASMPNATGTNYIIATDWSGPPVITQIPATNAVLALGTNEVILTATDTSGNASYSTNTIVVADETPPVIVSGPQSLTNAAGATATFTVAATACTPLAYAWFFNGTTISGATNAVLTLPGVGLANAGAYTVAVTAAGGSTTSAAATLTVYIPFALSAANDPGVGMVLNVTGPPNDTFIMEMTTNLGLPAGWLPLSTNLLDDTGAGQFIDFSATNDPQRFYRAVLGP